MAAFFPGCQIVFHSCQDQHLLLPGIFYTQTRFLYPSDELPQKEFTKNGLFLCLRIENALREFPWKYLKVRQTYCRRFPKMIEAAVISLYILSSLKAHVPLVFSSFYGFSYSIVGTLIPCRTPFSLLPSFWIRFFTLSIPSEVLRGLS